MYFYHFNVSFPLPSEERVSLRQSRALFGPPTQARTDAEVGYKIASGRTEISRAGPATRPAPDPAGNVAAAVVNDQIALGLIVTRKDELPVRV
jgi:hypothetical protein